MNTLETKAARNLTQPSRPLPAHYGKREIDMKKFRLFLLIAGLCFLTRLAPAEQDVLESGASVSRDAHIVSTIRLKPEPGSSREIPKMHVITFSDGRRLVRGQGTFEPNTKKLAFQYEINPAKGVYSVKPIDLDSVEGLPPEDSVPRPFTSAAPADSTSSGTAKEELEAGSSSLYSYSHRVMVRLQTLDPAYIRLTETSLWTDYNTNGNILLGGMDDSYCWAANPSALGTHWYIDYWEWDDGYGDNRFLHCTGMLSCGYHNWDFGFSGFWTIVDQELDLCVQADQHGKYTVSHWDAGEGAELIFGDIIFSKY